jgi:hypothetical protein
MFRNFAIVTALSLGLSGSTVRAQVILPGVPAINPPVQVLSPVVPFRVFQVQVRQLEWRERSFANPFDAREFALVKRSEGFETIMIRHTFHTHVRYRLPLWTTYRTVSSHHTAHELVRHLQFRGYEARVVHF